MIRFPETAATEWETVANAAEAEHRLRKRIQHDTEVEREAARLRVRHEASVVFQNELDADQTPVLEMVTLADYRANPAGLQPTAMIEGVLNENSTLLMLGPSGSGKSTLGLQMLNSLMTGEDWIGQPVKAIKGGAGVLSYDMDGGMVMDWMDGYPKIDQSKVSIVNAYKRGNPLGVPAMREQIVSAWKAMNVEAVMVDSFSASFFGHDQNDAAATMAHYRDIIKFALTEVGAKALIVIVHSTEGTPYKARGSTVHHDVGDAIVYVEGTGAASRKVDMSKYRAARGMTQMSPVVLTAPDPVTHLVDLDFGAMQLAGMSLPMAAGAAAFTTMPDPSAAPDLDSQHEDEDL